jgi:hypothetical protein
VAERKGNQVSTPRGTLLASIGAVETPMSREGREASGKATEEHFLGEV